MPSSSARGEAAGARTDADVGAGVGAGDGCREAAIADASPMLVTTDGKDVRTLLVKDGDASCADMVVASSEGVDKLLEDRSVR